MDNIDKILDKVYICLAKNSLDSNDETILLAYANAYAKLRDLHNDNGISPEKELLLQRMNDPYIGIFNKPVLTPGEKLLLDYYHEHILKDVGQSSDKSSIRTISNGHNVLDNDNMGFFKISSVIVMTILLGFILAILAIYLK